MYLHWILLNLSGWWFMRIINLLKVEVLSPRSPSGGSKDDVQSTSFWHVSVNTCWTKQVISFVIVATHSDLGWKWFSFSGGRIDFFYLKEHKHKRWLLPVAMRSKSLLNIVITFIFTANVWMWNCLCRGSFLEQELHNCMNYLSCIPAILGKIQSNWRS